nr:hypothetical protein [Tanacetum cinerariifolium]
MSKSAYHAPTPGGSVVRNTSGKGIKQTLDGSPGFMPDDKLREFCDKHYNQLLPLMAKKSFDRRKKSKKRRKPSPSTMSRSTYPSQSQNIFSRLKCEDSGPFRSRNLANTHVFTRLGERENDVFTRLGDMEQDVFSRLGSRDLPRYRHANVRQHASFRKNFKDPDQRRREARSLIRSYVTCSSERQKEIEMEWNAVDRENQRIPTPEKEEHLSESENSGWGHWKSRPKKLKSNNDEDDLSIGYVKKQIHLHIGSVTSCSKGYACQAMSRYMMDQEIRKIT